jgi:Fic family protein
VTDPVVAASRPPADLDARYQPFAPFAAWRAAAVDLDLRLVDEAASQLDDECRTADPATVRAVRDFAVRAAAFDTGAIEGLYETDRGVTFAVATQSAAWESTVAEVSGPEAVRHFEAHLRAFELVFDAATSRSPVSAAWLRALHETICTGQLTYRALTAVGWQDLPLPRGEYKRMPNHVRQPDGSWHSYAPVDQVTPEVQRLVDEVGSTDFADAHPVLQAAYVHHALVGIHPFADGNGRVARAAASVFLYRGMRVPLLVFVDQRLRYLAALRAADQGGYAGFIRFVRELVIDTIELMMQALRTARTAGAAGGLAALGGAEEPEPDQDQLHFLASRLHTAVRDELREAASELPGDLMSVRIGPAGPAGPGGAPATDVVASSPRRPGPGVTVGTTVVVSPAPAGPWPLRVAAEGADHRATVAPMGVRFGNLYPVLTTVTLYRIRAWARQVVDALAAELAGAPRSVS